MTEELPVGYNEEEDLINVLINPHLSKDSLREHPILDRDTILANLDEEDIETITILNNIREILDFSNSAFKSWESFKQSIERRMKLHLLLTRGKKGFQNKLLKTNIHIQRGGIEREPEDLEI